MKQISEKKNDQASITKPFISSSAGVTNFDCNVMPLLRLRMAATGTSEEIAALICQLTVGNNHYIGMMVDGLLWLLLMTYCDKADD